MSCCFEQDNDNDDGITVYEIVFNFFTFLTQKSSELTRQREIIYLNNNKTKDKEETEINERLCCCFSLYWF